MSVLYFDQLLGAAHTRKLVEIHNKCHVCVKSSLAYQDSRSQDGMPSFHFRKNELPNNNLSLVGIIRATLKIPDLSNSNLSWVRAQKQKCRNL